MGSLTLYCGLVLLTAWGGAAAPFLFHRRKPGHPFLHFFISFGAGIMLGAAFMHLLPDAFRLAGEGAGFAVLVGFLLLFLLESFSFSHPCEDDQHDYHALGWVAVLGLSLHNLVNGVALGASARVPVVGWVVFAATVAHKAPEFFSLSSILLAGRRHAWRTAALVLTVSVMIPLGAFASDLLLSQSGEKVLGLALGFSSGTFIHLAVVDLAPEMRQHRNRLAHFGSFLLGVALMALAAWLE